MILCLTFNTTVKCGKKFTPKINYSGDYFISDFGKESLII